MTRHESARPHPLTLATTACLAALAYGALADAQTPSPQEALRDRWRLSLELGVLGVQADRFSHPTLVSNDLSATGSVSLGVWRAVTSWLDLGGRAGLWLPDVRFRRFHTGADDCPAGDMATLISGDQSAPGVSAFVMPGVRLRPLGSTVPLHVNLGVAASVWASPAGLDAQWRCQSGPEHARSIAPESVFVVSSVVGVSSHFGAAEEFSLGIEFWQHLGGGPAEQLALGMTFGWEFNARRALPVEARGRGLAPTVAVAIAASVIASVGALLLNFPTH